MIRMSHVPTLLVCVLLGVHGTAVGQFVNWETPHVHPMDLTPDGSTLLVCNLADNRLEVFDVTTGTPVSIGAIPVGLDPVSVRARTDDEAWVVNHVSDSISVVDLNTMNVKATVGTLDEPADVVFAGSPELAFVACSQVNTVQVFDPTDLSLAPTDIPIDAEDPRAMAVSTDGTKVYVAVFESSNGTTILGGGADESQGRIFFPPNVVSDSSGPYGGQNPPPNDGSSFNPPIRPPLPNEPAVGLIVRKNAAGQWMDDNSGNWTDLVSGANADKSGRPVGWDMPDRDVAIIDTTSLNVTYATRLMNICMAIAVNPGNSEVTVVGTDATNEIRFEPVIKGRFTRVNIGIVDPTGPTTVDVVDLNDDHLDYSDAQISAQSNSGTADQSLRDKSIGDPRGIVWNGAGTRGYVTGMGSNNVIVIDQDGNRLAPTGAPGAVTIEVGEGPTGLALDESQNRLYVLNKFAGSISVIDTTTEAVSTTVSFYDPTPVAIKTGRKHLYDTHKNSALGQIACASCHVDARMDRIGWDLGDPDGNMKNFNQNCEAGLDFTNDECEDWHPMKGPMTTQTLQHIIGLEPLHWRGDRNGLEEFNGAFMVLQGDDQDLTSPEMQEFEDFLATIYFPPNPYRNFDNSLPTNLPLTGHFSDGRFAGSGGLALGDPMPNGNAVAGLNIYRPPRLLDDDLLACATCHSLPTGAGADLTLVGGTLQPIPVGPDGEHHLMVVSVDGSTNISMKVPHLRNIHEKVGFDMTQTSNRAGFGFLHDGSIDSITRFISEPIFTVNTDQEVANLVAFMLAFAGSDLPTGTLNPFQLEPLGPSSQDTHASVGAQLTADATNKTDPTLIADLAEFKSFADAGDVGLVAKGVQEGLQRGYEYVGGETFQSDRTAETISIDTLRLAADVDAEITFTIVSDGTENRIGIDRDQDGHYDRDELDCCSDPADANSTPGTCDPTTLTFNVVNGSWGTVTVDPNRPDYKPCMLLTLTAEPDEGREFGHWQIFDPNHPGDANYVVTDTNSTIAMFMGVDREITAVFKCGSSGALPPLAVALLSLTALGLIRRRVGR